MLHIPYPILISANQSRTPKWKFQLDQELRLNIHDDKSPTLLDSENSHILPDHVLHWQMLLIWAFLVLTTLLEMLQWENKEKVSKGPRELNTSLNNLYMQAACVLPSMVTTYPFWYHTFYLPEYTKLFFFFFFYKYNIHKL